MKFFMFSLLKTGFDCLTGFWIHLWVWTPKWFDKTIWLILLGHHRDNFDWNEITDIHKLRRNCSVEYEVDLHYSHLTLWAPTPQNGQTHSKIRRQKPTNCLSVFDHFVGLPFKGLKIWLSLFYHGFCFHVDWWQSFPTLTIHYFISPLFLKEKYSVFNNPLNWSNIRKGLPL